MKTGMLIASMTKAFAAAAIGELVAEGKMDWDTTSVFKHMLGKATFKKFLWMTWARNVHPQEIFIRTRSPEFGPALMYGIGWFLDTYKGNLIYRHGGNRSGYSSKSTLFPNSDLVIVQLANVELASLPGYLAYCILDKFLGSRETQVWLDDAVISQVGQWLYTNIVYGNATISLQRNDEDEEVLHFELLLHEGELRHFYYGTFSSVV
ncbi:hypothetical protein BGZ46_004216 [Entomortierella lignicola]|nr:hypothetical protein BGZ46_004216 [Entomortierella lignicola]